MSMLSLGLPVGRREVSAGRKGGERSARVRLVAAEGPGIGGAWFWLLLLLLLFFLLSKEVFVGFLDGILVLEGGVLRFLFILDGLIELMMDV
jgi:hypothetical protein